jgi:hypothetical protein
MDKWQIASTIATIIQGIVVIISLIFIWRQIQLQTKQLSLQTKLAKAANTQALVASPHILTMILLKTLKWLNSELKVPKSLRAIAK